MHDKTDEIFASFSVLVVEDETLIAMDIEEMLQDQGHRVLGPVGSVEDALRLLGDEQPDVATLDCNLRGLPVIPVARRLQEMGIPFVIVSGNGSCDFPGGEILAGAENVGKPISEKFLIAALGRAMSGVKKETAKR